MHLMLQDNIFQVLTVKESASACTPKTSVPASWDCLHIPEKANTTSASQEVLSGIMEKSVLFPVIPSDATETL